MPGLIFQKGNFYSNDASSPKISWFQILFKSVKPFGYKKRLHILQLPIPLAYCVSLIMVTITSHIFINIFQTVHFSTVKLNRGNEKNMSHLLIPKSLKVWKKSEVIGPGSFNGLLNNVIVAKSWIKTSFTYQNIYTKYIKIYLWQEKIYTTIKWHKTNKAA